MADDDPAFLQGAPWCYVGIVVERGDDDFVARLKIAANRAGERECERGHIRAEVDFVGRAAKKIGHRRMSRREHRIAAAAGGERAARVRVRLLVVVAHGVDHALGNLRSGGPVQERGRLAVHGLLQRRKLRAYPCEVQGLGCVLLDGWCAHVRRAYFSVASDEWLVASDGADEIAEEAVGGGDYAGLVLDDR